MCREYFWEDYDNDNDLHNFLIMMTTYTTTSRALLYLHLAGKSRFETRSHTTDQPLLALVTTFYLLYVSVIIFFIIIDNHNSKSFQTRDKLAPGELEQEIRDLRDPDPVIVAQGRPASPSEEIWCLTADPCEVIITKKVLTLLHTSKYFHLYVFGTDLFLVHVWKV